MARGRSLAALSVLLITLLPVVWSTKDVLKDVTLGFGEALKFCREEIGNGGTLPETMLREPLPSSVILMDNKKYIDGGIFITQSGLSEEKMEEFFHFWRDDFSFEHREIGCAIQCMSHRFNLLTDTHKMHHDNTREFIKSFPNGEVLANKMVDIIHNCEKTFTDEPDHCWRILKIAECFKVKCVSDGIAPSMEMIMAEFLMDAEDS